MLIAADILERDQKTVFYKDKKSSKGANQVGAKKNYLPEFLDIKKDFLAQAEVKKAQTLEKTVYLKSIASKLSCLRQIIDRNKENK